MLRGCEQRSGTSWHCPPFRRHGSAGNRPPSPLDLPTCWSIHCAWTSPLYACAIPTGRLRSRSREDAHGRHFRNGCSNYLAVRTAACRAGKSFAISAMARRGGRGIVIPVGVNAEGGLVAAACDRADFPGEIDQLLLSVAANHAATAFRMARLVDDHRRAEAALRESERQLRKARDDLETKVAERTAELQRSEAYLAEAQRLSHIGSFGWDICSGKLYWSEETFRIFECDRAHQPTMDFVLQRTHPEDRVVVRANTRSRKAGQEGPRF